MYPRKNIKISVSLHKRLKLRAIDSDTTIKELLEEIVEKHLDRIIKEVV